MSGTWSENNIFTTQDAIKFVTEAKIDDKPANDNNGGFEEL